MVNAMEVSNSPANSTNGGETLLDTANNGSSSIFGLTTLPRELELKANTQFANLDLQQPNFNLSQIISCAAKQPLNSGHRFGPYECKVQKQPNSNNTNWKVSHQFVFIHQFGDSVLFRFVALFGYSSCG